MSQGFLVTDADNTLWDTNKVFADAQLIILEQVEAAVGAKTDRRDRLAFVRQFDQNIAQRHEAGLKYPPELLIQALVDALGAAALSEKRVGEIVGVYFDMLAQKPRMRNGVRATLKWLNKAGVEIVVASEGREDRLRDNLDTHKLDTLVAGLVIGRKTREFFGDLYRLSADACPKVCVGDQLGRDITPAKEAGFTTLYFPGGFRPSWEFELGAQDADRIIKSYADVKDVFLLRDVA